MKIFIAGGTGFVGTHMVRHLAGCGHEVVVLARDPEAVLLPSGASLVKGDVYSSNLAAAMRGCDVVINLIGIIRAFPARGITFEKSHVEATRLMLEAAHAAGAGRFIQMSSNSARPGGVSEYQRTKFRAEELVRGTGLQWTIFRPSLVFGDPGKGKIEFCLQLLRSFRHAPVIPMFGDGNYRLQPVHVEDVARAFEAAAVRSGAAGRVFHLGGPVTYSYREILNMIFLGAGLQPRPKLPVPWFLARPFVSLLGNIPSFPATAEQIDMLLEGNTVPENDWQREFGITPVPFTIGALAYLTKYV